MKISDLNSAAEFHITEELFGVNANNVRLFSAASKAVVGGVEALETDVDKTIAGDRQARARVIGNAVYWVARWTRLGCIV